MTTLKALAEAREEILKAEVAALLHNIGKLDANFLATHVTEKSREEAARELRSRGLDIKDYQFRRFATPNPDLLLEQIRDSLTDTSWERRGRDALWKTLVEQIVKNGETETAVQDLLENWEEARTRHPVLARSRTAAWWFNRFTFQNGPLYWPLVDDLVANRREQDALGPAVTQARTEMDAASSKEKKEVVGRQYGPIFKQFEQVKAAEQQLRSQERTEQAQLEAKFQQITISVGTETWTVADLLTLFWDYFFFQPSDDPDRAYKRRSALTQWLKPGIGCHLPALLILSHGEVSGAEKPQDEWDEEEQDLQPDDQVTGLYFYLPQDWRALRSSSVFGYEQQEVNKWTLLDDRRKLLQTSLKVYEQPKPKRAEFTLLAERLLNTAISETRRPVNEITLWDYAWTIAALFKACVAGSILRGELVTVADTRWCLLHVSFDGLAFWGQAHHVTDMLGRRHVLQEGLDAIRDILEVQYPLGNEVYRDEHGSVFVVPDREDLLKLEDENGTRLKKLLKAAFDASGIWGELVPQIKVSGPYKGKEIKLAQVLATRRQKNIPDPDHVAGWWAESQRPTNAEICTVCGQRPVGYPQKGSPHEQELDLEAWADQAKAEDRNVCRVCLGRRGRRARDWARDVKTAEEELGPFERTIWTDEVADDNGRFALVVGRFVLDGWLDGKLIPTMLKSASFARIRRCWDTTRQFWLEVQNEKIPNRVGERVRLGLRPTNVEAINHKDPQKGLGAWHTYEADVSGRRLGLCWDPNDEQTDDRNLFWTTDNLRYQGRQLDFEEEDLKTEDKMVAQWLRRLNGRTLPLYEPGGYLGQESRANVDAEGCLVVKQERFHPFVPLMTEPATFMALVPADKALDVAWAIKAKYDREMARVRDRLPLHLGLVFAPRRTPLAAVLEAGQAMLEMPDGWKAWEIVGRQITEKTLDDGRQVPEAAILGLHPAHRESLSAVRGSDASPSDEGLARVTWRYPLLMGDGETPDLWYPHLLSHKPSERLKEKKELAPEGQEPELAKKDNDFAFVSEATGAVYVRPSRFDFVFLDTTARRFEIAYQTSEISETSEVCRPSCRTRPFLLDDLKRLDELWKELRHLEKSQHHQVIATIEATRETWFGADREGRSLENGVFRRFVRDTLAGAAWPERRPWKDLCRDKLDEQLVAAGVAGELADLAELHMQILKE